MLRVGSRQGLELHGTKFLIVDEHGERKSVSRRGANGSRATLERCPPLHDSARLNATSCSIDHGVVRIAVPIADPGLV